MVMPTIVFFFLVTSETKCCQTLLSLKYFANLDFDQKQKESLSCRFMEIGRIATRKEHTITFYDDANNSICLMVTFHKNLL